jgi:hypothetical protein
MKTYHVEQRAEVWVRATVEANTAAEAMELGKAEIDKGNYYQHPDSFELHDDFWIGGDDPNVEVSLNKDGSITELRIRD